MKTITIRELHNRTRKLVREASSQGEIQAQADAPAIPYFARRKPSAAFKRLDNSGKTGRGADSTITISQDRKDRT